ncbi:hypothetical protein [Acidipropionibacterium acidipropionici]|uniref:hypothetical protein n=1 Tax=Acidipropionibacterium acidipropionici TaxID=1748 RepID=UPI0012FE4585|nr:hypothetical protein [Acidipropionibacterium acidipropionici]
MVTDEFEKAAVRRIRWAPHRRWLVILPGDVAYYRFTYWADAIAFADKEMRK